MYRPTENTALRTVYTAYEIDRLYELLGFINFVRLYKRMLGYSDIEIAKAEGVTKQAVQGGINRKLKEYYPNVKKVNWRKGR